MIDEGLVEDQAGLALGPAEGTFPDRKTEALLRVGAAAIGAPPVCLECSTGRALAARASEDETTWYDAPGALADPTARQMYDMDIGFERPGEGF